jgi:hypothetical protein
MWGRFALGAICGSLALGVASCGGPPGAALEWTCGDWERYVKTPAGHRALTELARASVATLSDAPLADAELDVYRNAVHLEIERMCFRAISVYRKDPYDYSDVYPDPDKVPGSAVVDAVRWTTMTNRANYLSGLARRAGAGVADLEREPSPDDGGAASGGDSTPPVPSAPAPAPVGEPGPAQVEKRKARPEGGTGPEGDYGPQDAPADDPRPAPSNEPEPAPAVEPTPSPAPAPAHDPAAPPAGGATTHPGG